MMQIEKIRDWQLTQLENHAKAVESIIRAGDSQSLTTFRDNGTGWTVLEVLCHLRDFEEVFTQRAHLAVEQDNPPLPFPKPDELAIQNRYNEQNIEALAEWKKRRSNLIGYMRERIPTDWDRPAMHPVRGQLTLLEQLLLLPLHDTIHLEQMTRILNEKK
jgi:uncharacterized damage-inducible protein DinB